MSRKIYLKYRGCTVCCPANKIDAYAYIFSCPVCRSDSEETSGRRETDGRLPGETSGRRAETSDSGGGGSCPRSTVVTQRALIGGQAADARRADELLVTGLSSVQRLGAPNCNT